MNFNFGEVLTRAWQIIWKHKVLWIFGILASCGQGGGGSGGAGNSGFDIQNPGADLPPRVQQLFERIVENAIAYIAIFVAIACIFWIVIIFLGAIGKIGLIRGTFQAEEGAETLVVGQLFSESTPYLWRVFGLSLLVALPFFVMFAALVGGALAWAISIGDRGSGPGFAAAGIIVLCSVCCLVPVLIVIRVIARQAERAIVLEEMTILSAISRGWDVFRRNLGPVILMAIILAVIGLVTGFIVGLPVVLVVFPAMFTFMAGGAQSSTPLVFIGICICLYVPVAFVLNGIAIAYAESAWTLTYMRLTRKSDSTDMMTPPSETPPNMDDPDKTMISTSHA